MYYKDDSEKNALCVKLTSTMFGIVTLYCMFKNEELMSRRVSHYLYS